jgi:hypothetical protein
MRQLGIEKTIAGVSSLLNSMIMDGDQLTGAELASAFKEKLTDGRSLSAAEEEILQKIKLLRNEDGIVEIYTSENIPLRIMNFTISNHSRFKIIPLDNNDLKIKVIGGIEYDTNVLRGRVNSVIFELAAGSMIVDFGTDHQGFTKYFRN